MSVGNWMQFEAKRNPNTSANWDFWINGQLITTVSSSLPSGSVQCGLVVETNSTAVKGFDIDYFAMETINPLGQRWS